MRLPLLDKLPLIVQKKILVAAKGCAYAVTTWVALLLLTRFWEPAYQWIATNDLFFYKRFFLNPFTGEHHARASDDPSEKTHEKIIVLDRQDPTGNASRAAYAEALRVLKDCGAACIGVDIRFFEKKEWDAAGELELVQAVKNLPRLVLPISLVEQHAADSLYVQQKGRLERHHALPKAEARKFEKNSPQGNYVEMPFYELLQETQHIGHINFHRDLYHLFPLTVKCDNAIYPAFGYELARVYREYTGSSLPIKQIPTVGNSQLLVNFLPADKFKKYKLRDTLPLLRKQPELAKDKIVLLVNSSPEVPLPDTPLGGAPYPLWALHASIICQLLDDNNIASSRLTPLLLAMGFLLPAFLWILFVAERFPQRWRQIRWPFLLGNGSFVMLAFLMLQANYWLGVMMPMIIFSVALIAVRNQFYTIYQRPRYDIFSIAVTEAQKNVYPVAVVYSPAGEEQESVSFNKFHHRKSSTTMQGKFKQFDASLNDMRELGKELYQAIFQKSIETRLLQSLNFVKRDKNRLRIQLRLDAQEISGLPWEYMYSDELAVDFLALNRDISISRYIPNAATSELGEYRGPLKILVAIASAIGLDVKEEKAAIEKSLRVLMRLRQVKVHFCEHITLEKLDQEVSKGQYHVLHFIGHSDFNKGKGEGYLQLEDESGGRKLAEAEAIGTILHESSIRMVVLNSCEGAVAPEINTFFGVAQKLVKVGVPAVVAMQHKIHDDVAILFSREFYSSLLANYSVDAALMDARRAIMRRFGIDRQYWGTPVLFMRADGTKIFEVKHG